MLDEAPLPPASAPFTPQLLKWVGSKQRVAPEIVRHFPADIRTYREPFLGAGGVLATLAPARAVASDCFAPLMEIWRTLARDPERLVAWYAERWEAAERLGRPAGYEAVRAAYNARPNGADFLYLTRACYGGVVRFRKRDGHMSTPCGAHRPIPPEKFRRRVEAWHARLAGTRFEQCDYRTAFAAAEAGDLVYCDPPYSHSQAILYGAQDFDLADLFAEIEGLAARGVRVALSIDGTKKSGATVCDVPIPPGLFRREVLIDTGRSMLRRFQMEGRSLERETVADRLLLTY